MKNFVRMQLLLSVFAIATAFAQQAVPDDASGTVINGHGTKNIMSKFVGPHTIGNSGLVEANGKFKTTESISAGAIRATVNDPNGVGMWGLNNGSTGNAVGVRGESGSTIGFGVEGVSFSPTGTGIGILGEAASSDAFAGVFNNVSASGYPTGAFGYVTSSDGGIGILGRAWSTTGTGIGVRGEAFTPNGVAGSFDNTAGGNILVGMVSGSNKFRVDGTGQVFADGGYQTGGADFAESIGVRGLRALYEPGDLLVIDPTGNRRLTLAQDPYSTLVAGVYSTKPGMLASEHRMDDPSIALEVPLAVVGIVPCKVSTESGPINVGDLLVSSSSPGHAMKGTDRGRMLGAVVGKALEPLPEGSGVIQVLITLQ